MGGGIEKLNRQMSHLLGIQMEVIKTMKATKPVVEATTKAMEDLGDSSKETGKEILEVRTKLTDFIENKLRATSGSAGVFHKVMYGVPGYFIFKNRMDTLLSGIDKFILKPMSGDKKSGFLNKVLYGVGGSYRKSKEQLDNLLKGSAGQQTFASFFDQMEGGNTKLTAMGKGKAAVVNAMKNNKITKKALHFYRVQNKKERFDAFLSAKGKSLGKIAMSSLKALGTVALMAMKYFIIIGLALTGVFVLVKLLKKAGLDGEKLKEIGIGMFNIVKHFGAKIFENLKTMYDGIYLIYNAIFGDGTFGELLEGYFMLISGFLGVIWNLFLAVAVPIYYAGIEILKTAVTNLSSKVKDFFVDNLAEPIYKVINFMQTVLFILSLVALVIGGIIGFAGGGWTVALAGFAGIVGAAIADAIKDAIGNKLKLPFMANGGLSRGGLTVVGERGPELVRLPSGSRVHSNSESKRMMSGGGHNITVNVQGRIGASDSELRQIAQKVGQMINKEINRTTSSRGLGA